MKIGSLLAAFMLWLLATSTVSAAPSDLKFIVNQANPTESITWKQLVEIYQKRQRRWPNGMTVRFIDRNSGSEEHQVFVQKYLRMSDVDVDLFWINQKISTGNSEPIRVSSNGMEIQMVKAFHGAIGYVSAATPVAEGVKELKVIGSPP